MLAAYYLEWKVVFCYVLLCLFDCVRYAAWAWHFENNEVLANVYAAVVLEALVKAFQYFPAAADRFFITLDLLLAF